MPAITKSFPAVATSAYDPDSPITQELFAAIFDRTDHLREWMGAAYYAGAVQDHDHDGSNSKPITPAKSRAFTASTSESFVLVAGARYGFMATITQNTSSATPRIRFNSDTGSNYSRGGKRIRNTTETLESNDNETSCLIVGVSSNVGDILTVVGEIVPTQGNNNDVEVFFRATRHAANSQSNTDHFHGSCYYNGSADVTSMQLLTDAGTITGTFWLWRIYDNATL